MEPQEKFMAKIDRYTKDFKKHDKDRLEIFYSAKNKKWTVGLSTGITIMMSVAYDYIETNEDLFKALDILRFRNGMKTLKQ